MFNDRRRLWALIIFICFFALFVAFFMTVWPSIFSGRPNPVANAQTVEGANPSAVGGSPIPALGFGGAPILRTHLPILAAGDGRDVWVALPLTSDKGDKPVAGFELLNRPASSDWRIATQGGNQVFWNLQGYPRALMLLLPPPSAPFVIGDSGWVNSYTLDKHDPKGFLPSDDKIKAAVGATNELFVITLGRPAPSTARPGDSIDVSAAPAPARGPQPPATAAATGTAPASRNSAPTTAVSPEVFNTYWYPPPRFAATMSVPTPAATAPSEPGAAAETRFTAQSGAWAYLPSLGAPGMPGVPTASSLMALAAQDDRLIALWVDPLRNRELVARTLELNSGNPKWSDPPTVTVLPEGEAIPAPDSRLLTVTLDKTLYVLWTVPTGASVELHGGWMATRGANSFQILRDNFLAPMSLGTAGQGISPATDVAVGATGNSILAVVFAKDSTLQSVLFDSRGKQLAGPAVIEPHLPARDLQIGQNIAMVMMAMILLLSLWQWRQKPVPLALPSGLVVAPVHLRAGGCFIDAAAPYIAVLAIFGMGEGGNPLSWAFSWISLILRPEELFKSGELFVFLGLYLLHVTGGELFFRKSLGKAILGLQVLMLDGKAPTLAAILLRNLVRLPEMAVGIALMYILFSQYHQRLGDLLSRTIVVTQKPPETPPDPDKGPGK